MGTAAEATEGEVKAAMTRAAHMAEQPIRRRLYYTVYVTTCTIHAHMYLAMDVSASSLRLAHAPSDFHVRGMET